MTYKCKQVDIGDKCVECLRSTSFGTGLFVNRIPADNDEYIDSEIGNELIEDNKPLFDLHKKLSEIK